MTADLDAVAGVALVVGGVDDPGRQPQHALLDVLQDRGVVADRGRRGGTFSMLRLPLELGRRGPHRPRCAVQATVTDLAGEVRARQR